MICQGCGYERWKTLRKSFEWVCRRCGSKIMMVPKLPESK